MKSFLKILIAVVIASQVLLQDAFSHSPHHVITEVAISPSTDDYDVFILITDQIFKSDSQGRNWKILENGLTNQFPFTSIVISPNYETDGTIFISSAGDGVYRSLDHGNSWEKFNVGLEETRISKLSISINTANELRILAAAEMGGVWRFSAKDAEWRMVLTEAATIRDFAEMTTSGSESIVIGGGNKGRVWRSKDDGKLWELLANVGGSGSVTSIDGSAEDFFVGTTNDGLYHSRDGGQSFSHVKNFESVRYTDCLGNEFDQPRKDLHIRSISAARAFSEIEKLLVTTWYGGVFVSTNMGESWSQWDSQLRCDPQANTMQQPHYRNIAIVDRGTEPVVYWLAAFDGLFRGEGDEPQWEQRETLPVGLIKGMATSVGRDDAAAIGLSTYGGGFYLTEDYGDNWTIGNRGLRTTRLTGLSFSADFSRDGVIYGGAGRRLLRSTDHGASWAPITLHKPDFGTRVGNKLVSWGLPRKWFSSADTQNAAMVYPTQIVQPAGSLEGQVIFGTRSHGVWGYDETADAVEAFEVGRDGVVNSLSISPDFEHDHTIFAGVRGTGLLRSVDDGLTWSEINSGLRFINRWLQNPAGADFRRDIQLAISPNFRTDDTLFLGSPTGDGLYVSRDRGSSWSHLPTDITTFASTLAIAISPNFATDKTLVVSEKGMGLFRSTDAGESFAKVGDSLLEDNFPIELLTFAHQTESSLTLIGSSDEHLFVSHDVGDTWTKIVRPIRYEDMRDRVRFSGPAATRQGNSYSARTETLLSTDFDRVSLDFVGDGIRWIGSRDPDFGQAEVYIDGKKVSTVDCRASTASALQTLFETRGLGHGAHTLEIRLAVDQNEASRNVIAVDAFDVLPQTNPVR